MSYEKVSQEEAELNALREVLPVVIESEGKKDQVEGNALQRTPYSHDTAKRVVDWYAQGISLQSISRKSEMPSYSTLLRWSKEHPELSKMLRSVREARATHFEDAAIDAAEAACGKDADRLKVETYKWAAEVNDPTTYGKKVAHSGDATHPIVLQVVTGFGPPNPWQASPKLLPDGTIDKTVQSEASVVGEQPVQEREDASGVAATPVGGIHSEEGGPTVSATPGP